MQFVLQEIKALARCCIGCSVLTTYIRTYIHNIYWLSCILHIVGTFGQAEPWKLSLPSTYQHPKLPNETIFDTQGLPSINTITVGDSTSGAGSDVALDTGADKQERVDSAVSLSTLAQYMMYVGCVAYANVAISNLSIFIGRCHAFTKFLLLRTVDDCTVICDVKTP